LGAGILAILAYGVVSGRLPLPAIPGIGVVVAPPASDTPPVGAPSQMAGTASSPRPRLTPSGTLPVTLIGPASSADGWANALLDQFLGRLTESERPGDGFAWWQGSEAIGFLRYEGHAVHFKGGRLSIDDQTSVDIWIVSQNDPNALQRIGTIQTEASALVLGVTSPQSDRGDLQWIATGSAPDTALSALVIQTAARSAVLRAAYDPGSGQNHGALVLLGAQVLAGTTQTAVLTGTARTVTPQPPAGTPTPTHAPEASLGLLIETRLKPVIDVGLSFPPDVVAAFTAAHAWNGTLTWDESGPKVDNRPVNVNQASELTFQILTPNDPRGPAQPFLRTEYTGNVTRFPDEQMYFTGQRMNEVLYWMVAYGARRGGLLRVSYDDFGTRQAMTIIGFAPFIQPGSQTPNP
jgi:hypothetical protein